MKKLVVFIIVIFSFLISNTKLFAQTDSSHIRISLLTCSPGADLYAVFGHTALRITDSTNHSDIVYNYGTFNFEEPNFYLKFTTGKLDYALAYDGLPQFLYNYTLEKRNIYEQELNLTAIQKQNIISFLQQNLIGNNKYYKYDFFYDNCTTRIRDILTKQAGLTITKPLVPAQTTFRNMIHIYLDSMNMCWSKLGIDILLGSPTDKKLTIYESVFLPDYLLKAVDSSTNTPTILISNKKVLLNVAEPITETSNQHYPFYLIGGISLILLLISFSKNKILKKITIISNSILLYITGLLGLVILFMMFCTDHKACAANYNLLWALPTNIIAAFALFKKPNWLIKYFYVVAFISAITIVTWSMLPQQLNIALLPIVILLLNMSARMIHNSK
ncbi:MAG: DUF4105 domain-containing protein [Bacteroidetes bacterium]|nr:DUF4105 domain-containing protein [Bacteroidota bacterium]MBS1648539.1 DUF4105 domain-containing protein [Bacteroidota bacterium]